MLRRRCAALALLVTLPGLAGCVSNSMRDAASEFAQASQSATQSQRVWIGAYTESQQEAYRDRLAGDRARIVFNPGCAGLANFSDAEETADAIEKCWLATVSQNRFERIAEYEEFGAILELNSALLAYSESLVELTANWDDERKALAQETKKTGESLQALHASVTKLSILKEDGRAAQLPAIGGIFGSLAGAYLEAKRLSTLRTILATGDPLVAQATQYLTDVDTVALAADRKLALDQLSASVDALNQLRDTADASAFRARQDEVRAAHSELIRVSAIRSPFPEMREAHTSLLAASRKGASPGELQSAIVEILELAKSAKIVADNLKKEKE